MRIGLASTALAFAFLGAAMSCGGQTTTEGFLNPDEPDRSPPGETPSEGGPIDDGGAPVDARSNTTNVGQTTLYAIIAQKLVIFDQATGAIEEVAPVGNESAPLAWDEKNRVARVVM